MPLAQKGSERENSSSNKDELKHQAFLRLVNPRTIIAYRERQLIKNYNFFIMNLEKMKLTVLNIKELKKTNGGIFGIDDLIIGVLIAGATTIMGDWENFERGLKGHPPKK